MTKRRDTSDAASDRFAPEAESATTIAGGASRPVALLVLGMHRSGTSAWTGVLERLGAAGPRTPLPPNEANPKGYAESRQLMQLHERMLAESGSSWDDWSTFNPDWGKSQAGQSYGEQIRALVDSEYGGSDVIAVKDPRICRFAKYWIEEVERGGYDVRVLHVLRNPLEVAQSLQARDGMEILRGLLLWLRHVLDAEAATRSKPRVFARYEALVEDWRRQISRVGDALQVAWPRRSPAVDLEIDDFLTGALRRQQVDRDALESSSAVPSWVAEVYDLLARAASTGEMDAQAKRRLTQIRETFDQSSAVFAPLVARADRQMAAYRDRLDAASAQARDANEELEQTRADRDSLKRELAKMESAAGARQRELNVIRSERATLQRKLVEARSDSERLRNHLDALQVSTEELEFKREALSRELARWKMRSAATPASATDAAGSEVVRTLREERARLVEAVEGLRGQLRDAEERERDLHRRLFSLTPLAGEASGSGPSERVARQIEHLKKERDYWVEQAKNARGCGEDADLQLTRMQAQLDSANAGLNQERERRKALRKQMIRQLQRIQLGKPVPASMRKRLEESPAFDCGHYERQLARIGLESPDDPIAHFVNVGAHAGIDPHPLFSVDWYLARNPDVAGQGLNPLAHYLEFGDKEGRSPHPLFDPHYYFSQNMDASRAGKVSLCHYLKQGWREGREPNAWFYSSWYLEQNEDVRNAGLCPLVHYVLSGEAEGRRPHPSFDPEWYREQHIAASPELSPLAHFLSEGRKQQLATQQMRADHWSNKRKTILAVAHSAGEKLFGGERSFYDVVSSLDPERFRVIVVLPVPHQNYIDLMSGVADQIHFVRGAWWRNGNGARSDVLARYQELIENEGVDVVYANTIVLSEPLLAAKKCGVPGICHIREAITEDPDLQSMIGKRPEEIIEAVRDRSDYIIANSRLTERIFSKPGRTCRIYNAVDVDAFDRPAPDPSGRPLVVGMLSSNIPKKGIADAVELADASEKAGLSVRFRLIGPHTDETRRLEKAMAASGPKNVEFPGYASDAKEAIESLDVVINFSHFAESFGRTIAEASAMRRPVIVYDHGALPEVVAQDETGFVIPYREPLKALECLKRLSEDPELFAAMGEAGRERAVSMFSRQALREQVNEFLETVTRNAGSEARRAGDKTQPRKPGRATEAVPVSVIVPNYNYEGYLPERLNSILEQTRKPAEIIFLDDNSSDDSVAVARGILEDSDIPFKIIANETNRGVYRQWLTGIAEAGQPWVWIAEADDRCEPDFLESLMAKAEKSVNLIYSQSKKIDDEGIVTAEDNRAHTDDISQTRWNSDYVEVGVREVSDALIYRNTVPNASAALLRKSAVAGIESKLAEMRYAGDWMLYGHLLRGGKVAFVSRSLNHFRRHASTVTSTQGKSIAYLEELARIREYFTQNFPVLPRHIERMDWFLNRDYKIEGVEQNSRAEAVSGILKRAEANTRERARIAFITTNNGSHYGGSEMLWRETAMEMCERGHDVFVLIKAWEPRPDFFDELERAGVKLLFKEDDGFDQLVARKPDLTVVSIGDQDEGTEFYQRLDAENLPYVIVNQLTKEPRFWPVRKDRIEAVRAGYQNAEKVFFTCWNNHRVMEERLGAKVANAELHFNPYHVDRNQALPWPESERLQVAIPSKLLFIHKGQDILVEVATKDRWKERPITFNFYGVGPDEERLREMAQEAGIENFHLHGRVSDISVIWRDNHALLMPSRMEGMPIMLISAMLSARVPILTDIGGHAEVVRDNESGFIAANPNAKDLEEALERAYRRRDEWAGIGRAARADVLDFLPAEPVNDFVEKLRAVLASRFARAA
ncbi:hypothetical protein DDZ18_03660 [Marinicauda salina]|uniref:Glycosyltransferase n=1 Tax=Marinicauda salina TaxID=2135793 RepID=A0A2U2BXH4_9PROT|nr:glycosyltransferase [Marinicauda salina]PWE18700.1 hypothetical protein DDZ18_03660 [Marinicauda salina]